MAVAIEGLNTLLIVYDVPTSVAFYRDILGFEVAMTSAPFTDAKDDYGWAKLRLNGVELMLNNMYEDNIRPPAPDPARSRAHGDTILYFTCRELDATYEYLRARGVAAQEPTVTWYGMRQVFVADPDGYSIVFQWPTDRGTPATTSAGATATA